MMQCRLTNQWPSYPPGIHIRPTITKKSMLDCITPSLPQFDLKKKKGKVPPYNKPMLHPGPKDTIALHPIPYDWSRNFTRDVAKKIIALKLDVEFDQNDTMLFYFKDMYEYSHLASTSEYDKEDTSNDMRMVQILHPAKIYRFNEW